MSLGTVTLTKIRKNDNGPLFVDHLSFPGDSAYPTGGTAAFQAAVRTAAGDQRTISHIEDIGGHATYYPVYDKANDKLKVFVRATGLEVGAAVDISAATFKIAVVSY